MIDIQAWKSPIAKPTQESIEIMPVRGDGVGGEVALATQVRNEILLQGIKWSSARCSDALFLEFLKFGDSFRHENNLSRVSSRSEPILKKKD